MSLEKDKSTAAHKTSLLLVIIGLLLFLFPGSDEASPGLQVSAQESTQVTYRSLAITEATISPEPIVGQLATLYIEVVSPRDETDVSVDVLLPEEIQLVDGELSWQGALSANQPHVHEISIIVLEEGDWRIHIGVSSRLSETNSIGDGDILHIASTADSAQVVPSIEYRVTESEYGDIWPYHEEHVPDISRLRSVEEGTLAVAGMVTVKGVLTFDALEADCFDAPICTSDVLNQPLEGAVVELWDRNPDAVPILLATGLSDGIGFYSLTVVNEDPDGSGTGIDPVLLIYAMGERIQVVNSLESLYFAVTPDIGQDVADGVIPFDHHTPRSDTSQAMYIFDILNRTDEYMESEVAWGNADLLEVNWPQGCVFGLTEDACYYYGRQLYIPELAGRQADVLIHEYGHFALSRYVGEISVIEACASNFYNHSLFESSTETCAWSEGWATFFEMAVQSSGEYLGYDLETPSFPNLTVDPPPYDIWEASVAAVLWDIFDGTSTVEPLNSFDTVSDGFDGVANNGIWYVSITDPAPQTLNEFYGAWHDRSGNACSTFGIYQNYGLAYPPLYNSLVLSAHPVEAGYTLATPLCPGYLYAMGTDVTLAATPFPPYVFYSWTVNGNTNLNDGSAIVLNMDSDIVAVANFSVPDIGKSIIQSSDDAGSNPLFVNDCSDYGITGPEIYLGHCQDGSPIVSGFRFQNVIIPNGATITNARLKFTVDGPYTDIIDVQFQGELTDDAVPFSNTDRPIDRSPLTSAIVPWYIEDQWLVGFSRSSSNVRDVVQEVIDQSGWTSGNSIVFIVQPSGSGTVARRVFAWDRLDNALRSAQLHVWFTSTSNPDVIYVSSTTGGTAGGVSFKDEDILSYDTGSGTWAIVFDGSDVGVTVDVNAFTPLADGSLLLSLNASATVSDLGKVDDSDVIRFIPTTLGADTAGTFEWYFDGSDVDLTTNGEDVDALNVLDDGRILFSTTGTFNVSGAAGVDEDLIVFTPTTLGSATSGSWAHYFDGSDVDLNTARSEDVNGTWQASNGDIYLTTLGAFVVTGASGDGADIFACTPGSLGATTSCTFSMYWDGSANGFAGEVMDGFYIDQ